MITLSNRQARRFMLLKHGLLGEHKFIGKQGVLDFVRQAGCIQYDPVDVCGRNAELTLQSRIGSFTKRTLYELLYCDRKLFDYPDKNQSIIPIENWPYFERYRNFARISGIQFAELKELETEVMAYIEAQGPVSSGELPIQGNIHWHSAIHWSGNWHGNTNAARSVLEQLYSTGQLVIHHKKGTRKYYDLAIKHLDLSLLNAPDPLPDDFEHQKWIILRRIGAVGLMWNRASDAWLNIWGLKTPQRSDALGKLLGEGKILEVKVENLKDILYCRIEDMSLIDTVFQKDTFMPRCELIAPLDCIMWDRKLIRALFDFDYTWEIYTPASKRKYGYYVLPLLYGDEFIGRLEAVADRKINTLNVKNIWYQNGVKLTKSIKKAIGECISNFAIFNKCDEIDNVAL